MLIKLRTMKFYFQPPYFSFPSLAVQSLPSLYLVSSLLLHSDLLFWVLSEAAVEAVDMDNTTETDLTTTSKSSYF